MIVLVLDLCLCIYVCLVGVAGKTCAWLVFVYLCLPCWGGEKNLCLACVCAFMFALLGRWKKLVLTLCLCIYICVFVLCVCACNTVCLYLYFLFVSVSFIFCVDYEVAEK